MTATQNTNSPAPVEEVTVTIDGVEVSVPKGTRVLRAAEKVGIHVPRFCDHPLLEPQGSCRQCLVEVSTPDREGNIRAMPKPQTSCTLTATPGMVVNTQHTSPVADKAQHGMIEFLLVNHPLDCPVCDKGGECPLQNQSMSNGYGTSRYDDAKRTFPKPVKISTQILLDRDRCILCQRCTRFQDQIAGDPFITIQGRGGGAPGLEVDTLHGQQVSTYDEGLLDIAPFDGADGAIAHTSDVVGPEGVGGPMAGMIQTVGSAEIDSTSRPFASYFSGNTIQICPVGALTSSSYRFRSRPFDLISTDSIAEHDACGSAIRVDHRRSTVMRRLAGEDLAVNEEWITDKDRFAFTWQTGPDALTTPLVRSETTGELESTSWSEAIALASAGLRAARQSGGLGLLPGGRLTLEDSYAWSKFARVVCGTNDIDFRARQHSAEEADFLGHHVAGSAMEVTFGDLEKAGHVLLVGFEPEEEAGTIFLRLRKGMRAGSVSVSTIAPFATRGSTKMRAHLITTDPGAEAAALTALAAGDPAEDADALKADGAVILVGERLSQVPGGYTAALALADATGARLAWVPRRAGDRGAVEAGLLPGLLPGGRPVSDPEARVDVAAAWGVDSLPETSGRDLEQIIAAAASADLGGLVVGGLDIEDLPDPAAVDAALAAAGFVLQLEVRQNAVSAHADVVLPVATPTRKSGTFLNWEGRPRPFGQVFPTSLRSDAGVLDMLADAMDVDLGTADPESALREVSAFGGWDGARPAAPQVPAEVTPIRSGQYVLATWRMMLDSASGQDGEPYLAGTAHRPVVRISPTTARALGLGLNSLATVTGPAGQITLPVLPTAMPDHVVWVPQHSPGSSVNRMLGITAGAGVSLGAATAEVAR